MRYKLAKVLCAGILLLGMTDIEQVTTTVAVSGGTASKTTDVSLKMSTFAFGLRAGFFLSQ